MSMGSASKNASQQNTVATASYPQPGMPYGYADITQNIEDAYYIEIEQKRSDNYSFPTKLKFYSEEEFVFSFINLYNSLQEGKKFCATANGVYNLENINSVVLKSCKNGVFALLSPIHILERAKEFGHVI